MRDDHKPNYEGVGCLLLLLGAAIFFWWSHAASKAEGDKWLVKGWEGNVVTLKHGTRIYKAKCAEEKSGCLFVNYWVGASIIQKGGHTEKYYFWGEDSEDDSKPRVDTWGSGVLFLDAGGIKERYEIVSITDDQH